MKKIFLAALIFLFFNDCFGQEQFQLAPPMLNYTSTFFKESTAVSLKFAQPGTQIFYTLNKSEPTRQDAAYKNPILIKKPLTALKAKVFGNGFLPSETVQVTFIKDGLKIKSIKQSTANKKFPGNGDATLFDNQGGIEDLHNKNFLGYQNDSVEINVTLEKKQPIHSLLLDFLQDNGSWIFLPQRIQVFYFDNSKNGYEFFGAKEIAPGTIIKGSSTVFEMINTGKKINSNRLRIIIEPLQSIPEGHPGKGTPAWLFIDEIKIY
ncbi:MAG: chitobiase/beta-hexosaminidase C-terminal domain-containing protein [Ginsengibacter sp.]